MKRKNKREELLERERQILKETLEIIIKENSELKENLSDIKTSVNENKIQLKEKMNSITNKDTAVEMLSNQIEAMKQKFYDLQLKQKMQSLLNNNISEDIINSKGNETNNTNLQNNTNNQLMSINAKEGKFLKEKENQIKTIEDKIGRQKSFFEKQQDIRNEIINLKRDVNYLREKINENKSKYILYQYNCDIQKNFKNSDLIGIKRLLNKNPKSNLLYLVTNNGFVYKIKRRDDLNKDNFIDKLYLDFISNDRKNEIVNIREKIKNENNSNEYQRKLSLCNNKFNNNLENVIRCTINPNFLFEKRANKKVTFFDSSIKIATDNSTSRNNPKQNKIHSYVTELLKGTFVL